MTIMVKKCENCRSFRPITEFIFRSKKIGNCVRFPPCGPGRGVGFPFEPVVVYAKGYCDEWKLNNMGEKENV